MTAAAPAVSASETFGAVLRRRRLAAGLSQGQLARLTGVARETINRFEHGVYSEPSPVSRYALRTALGLSESDDDGWWGTRW